MAEMLTTADYVKFAKFIPLQDENARYLDTAYEFVNNTHQRIEEKLAEQRKEEERKQEEERQRQEEEKAKAEAEEQAKTNENNNNI